MDPYDESAVDNQLSKDFGDISISDRASAHVGDHNHHSRDVHIHFHYGDVKPITTTGGGDVDTNLADLLGSLLNLPRSDQGAAHFTARENVVVKNQQDGLKSVSVSLGMGTNTLSKTLQTVTSTNDRPISDSSATAESSPIIMSSRESRATAMYTRAEELAQKARLATPNLPLVESLYGKYQHGKRTFICATTPQDVANETSVFAAAKLFSMAKQPKFVYIRDRRDNLRGTTLFTDMVGVLAYQVARFIQQHNADLLQPVHIQIPQQNVKEHELVQDVHILCTLLSSVREIFPRMLIIIEGMEYAASTGQGTKDICAIFLRELRNIVAKQEPSRLRFVSVDQEKARLFRPLDGDVSFCT